MLKANSNKFLTIFSIVLFIFASTTGIAVAASQKQQSEEEFQIWLIDFKAKAIKQGIKPETVNSAFKNITLNHRVLELDRSQPEFFKTFWQYFNRAVTDWRITKGKELLQEHQQLLAEVTKKHGIPERILVSFWGMETNYGSYTGKTPIIEALATLSFDERRRKYFSKELLNALKIIDKGYISPKQMQGSWAGAMGQCQFMPSNYLRYSVDADNDGKRDLWNSYPDIFFSMGNFLEILGWEKGMNWGREVQLPKGFNLTLADGKQKKSLEEWRELGIKLADGRNLPTTDKEVQAALLLPYDYRGPAFLVYKNFFVIKKWNNSNNYALAVGHLADRIVGRDSLTKQQPEDDQAMSREQVKEMQQRLIKAGFDLGKADGVAGKQTRSALRAYQNSINIPADGYPSYRMLNILRKDLG